MNPDLDITPIIIYKNDSISTILFANNQAYEILSINQAELNIVYNNSFSKLIFEGLDDKKKTLDELVNNSKLKSKSIIYTIATNASKPAIIIGDITYDGHNNIFYETISLLNNPINDISSTQINIDNSMHNLITNHFINDNDFDYALAVNLQTNKLLFVNNPLLEKLNCPLDYDYTNISYYDFLKPLNLSQFQSQVNKNRFYDYGCNEFIDNENYRNIMVNYKTKFVENIKILFINIKIKYYNSLVNSLSSNNMNQSLMLLRCLNILNFNQNNSDDTVNKLLNIINSYYLSSNTIFIDSNNDNKKIYIKSNNKINFEIINFQSKEAEDNIINLLYNETKLNNIFYYRNVRQHINYEELKLLFGDYNISSLLLSKIENNNSDIMGYLLIINPEENINIPYSLKIFSLIFGNYLFNNTLINKLSYLSYHDSLTKVHNYNSYKEKIKYLQINKCNTIGISFIDMNGLKLINDTFGHVVGDDFLNRIGHTLYDNFGDEVYRIGGDEFVILSLNISNDLFIKKMNVIINQNIKNFNNQLAIGFKWYSNNDNIDNSIKEVEKLMYIEKSKYYTNNI